MLAARVKSDVQLIALRELYGVYCFRLFRLVSLRLICCSDINRPAVDGAVWTVSVGYLHETVRFNTFLICKRDYGNRGRNVHIWITKNGASCNLWLLMDSGLLEDLLLTIWHPSITFSGSSFSIILCLLLGFSFYCS